MRAAQAFVPELKGREGSSFTLVSGSLCIHFGMAPVGGDKNQLGWPPRPTRCRSARGLRNFLPQAAVADTG